MSEGLLCDHHCDTKGPKQITPLYVERPRHDKRKGQFCVSSPESTPTTWAAAGVGGGGDRGTPRIGVTSAPSGSGITAARGGVGGGGISRASTDVPAEPTRGERDARPT